jgi:hypothetical protein
MARFSLDREALRWAGTVIHPLPAPRVHARLQIITSEEESMVVVLVVVAAWADACVFRCADVSIEFLCGVFVDSDDHLIYFSRRTCINGSTGS